MQTDHKWCKITSNQVLSDIEIFWPFLNHCCLDFWIKSPCAKSAHEHADHFWRGNISKTLILRKFYCCMLINHLTESSNTHYPKISCKIPPWTTYEKVAPGTSVQMTQLCHIWLILDIDFFYRALILCNINLTRW